MRLEQFESLKPIKKKFSWIRKFVIVQAINLNNLWKYQKTEMNFLSAKVLFMLSTVLLCLARNSPAVSLSFLCRCNSYCFSGRFSFYIDLYANTFGYNFFFPCIASIILILNCRFSIRCRISHVMIFSHVWLILSSGLISWFSLPHSPFNESLLSVYILSFFLFICWFLR